MFEKKKIDIDAVAFKRDPNKLEPITRLPLDLYVMEDGHNWMFLDTTTGLFYDPDTIKDDLDLFSVPLVFIGNSVYYVDHEIIDVNGEQKRYFHLTFNETFPTFDDKIALERASTQREIF